MNRRIALGRALGALNALAFSASLAASGCTSADGVQSSGGAGGAGAAGGAGGAGGTAGGVGGAGGAGGASGGSVATGGSAGVSAGGSAGATGGASQSGAGGTVGGSAGAGLGGNATGGGSSGEGGTPVATGGVANAGQAGSGAGSAGMPTGGSGGQGGWWFDGPRTPPAAGTWPPPNIKLTDVVTMVTQPTAIAAPRGDTTRLFVTEKWGRIRLIKNGVLQPTPALDMRAAVLEGGPQTGAELMNQGKRGLVGLAFHPDYETNGRIFVMYVADQGEQGVYGTAQNAYDDGDMTFAEYRRSASNPDVFDPQPVGAPFLQFDKGNCNQCSQHNGGSLEVDVDGFLWASTGDPPPYDNPGSQDLNNLNGKLLRFDISGSTVTAAGNYPGADPYVASIGIRNAYKFSVDRYTGDLYVGDVGENSWEEITVERYGQRNKDHGWPKMEGTAEYMGPCNGPSCLAPVYDYPHTGAEGTPGADNCVIGGYVYRGAAIPALQGAYLYGDNGSGKVRAIQVQNGTMVQGPHTFAGVSIFMGCFGEDAAGELYVCDYNNNKVVRVDAQ
jgi:glucose/arabinose dehydrogenase